MGIINAEQGLAPPPGQVIDQDGVVMADWGLRGHELMEPVVGPVIVRDARRCHPRAALIVLVVRVRGGVRAVRGKVSEPRPPAGTGAGDAVAPEPCSPR